MAPRICGLSFCRLYHQFNFWPNGFTNSNPVGQTTHDDTEFDLAHDHGPFNLTGHRCALSKWLDLIRLAPAHDAVESGARILVVQPPLSQIDRRGQFPLGSTETLCHRPKPSQRVL